MLFPSGKLHLEKKVPANLKTPESYDCFTSRSYPKDVLFLMKKSDRKVLHLKKYALSINATIIFLLNIFSFLLIIGRS